MNREQRVKDLMLALGRYFNDNPTYMSTLAEFAVDAILPQTTTVEELAALPIDQVLIGNRGEFGPVLLRRSDDFSGRGVTLAGHPYSLVDALHFFGPLVVWQP